MTPKYEIMPAALDAAISRSFQHLPPAAREAAIAYHFFLNRRAWREIRGKDRFRTRYVVNDPAASAARRVAAKIHAKNARALGFRGSIKAAIEASKQAA